MDVSSSLIAVGASGLQAVVWMPNGSGGWNAPTFVGDSGSRVNSINNAGTIAVGHARGPLGSIVAAYWTNTGGTWSGPTILLDGTCARADAVDDAGHIRLKDCLAVGQPAVSSPPYTSTSTTMLVGLGDPGTATSALNMSTHGTVVVGTTTLKGVQTAVYWPLP